MKKRRVLAFEICDMCDFAAYHIDDYLWCSYNDEDKKIESPEDGIPEWCQSPFLIEITEEE
ncbi:MAG: hypothetical protein LBQ00_06695 [Syntrophobacterales bacterium]|jgi:hypothetical protein|nr:hypothetical protein [Syntrophobacterales bacterium]